MSTDVLVLGSVSRDVTVTVADFPAPGETVLGREVVYGLGGKGANQAVAAALSGVATEFAGCVGSDDVGAALRTELEDRGVGTAWLSRLEDEASGSAHITVDAHGENSIAVVPAANARVDEALVRRLAAEDFSGATVLLSQGEIPVATLEALARELGRGRVDAMGPAGDSGAGGVSAAAEAKGASERDAAAGDSGAGEVSAATDADANGAAAAGGRAPARPRWILNLAPAAEVSAETLAAADVLVVNETEAAAVLRRLGERVVVDTTSSSALEGSAPGGSTPTEAPVTTETGVRTEASPSPEASPKEAAGDPAETARRLTRLSPGVVLTLGAAGSVVAVRGQDRALSIPATPAASVVDTTGAGDAFTGVFGAALATRLRDDADAWGPELLAQCAGIAAREAAKVVARPGASSSYEEFSLAPR